MKNVLMQVCRAMHRYNERQIAAKLGMTPEDYIELETGATIMKPAQAEWLSDVYNIDREYFLESSQQLDLLLAQAEALKHLNAEIERIKKFVFVHKDLLLDSKRESETEGNDKNAGYEQETTRQ
jgi:transcriptional regulator with XRE-family HTH domain